VESWAEQSRRVVDAAWSGKTVVKPAGGETKKAGGGEHLQALSLAGLRFVGPPGSGRDAPRLVFRQR
jgi:hypothetical protein